jgi:hypothetical protein
MGWGNKGNINDGKVWLMFVVWIQLCLIYSDDNGIPRVKTNSVVRYEEKLQGCLAEDYKL